METILAIAAGTPFMRVSLLSKWLIRSVWLSHCTTPPSLCDLGPASPPASCPLANDSCLTFPHPSWLLCYLGLLTFSSGASQLCRCRGVCVCVRVYACMCGVWVSGSLVPHPFSILLFPSCRYQAQWGTQYKFHDPWGRVKFFCLTVSLGYEYSLKLKLVGGLEQRHY